MFLLYVSHILKLVYDAVYIRPSSGWHLPLYSVPSVIKVERWLTAGEKPSNKFKAQVASVLQSFLYLGVSSAVGYIGQLRYYS